MSLVEHAQIQDDPSEHAALTSTEKKTARDQASIALHCAHASSDNAPRDGEHGQVFATSNDFEKPV